MKRIITCNDGTWNDPGEMDGKTVVTTNVARMFNLICAEGVDQETGAPVRQLKAYDEGVGTGYSFKDQVLGGIAGEGLDTHIKDMYTFLCLNYEIGDEIYLFGFSRGAYTARSICGFIRNCGLLRPQFIHLVELAFKLYRGRNNYTAPNSDLMKSFRSNYCYEDITRVHFIGVWDTVGSLGLPLPTYKMLNQKKYRFHDVTLGSTVKNAYHALSIDDRRKLFEPTLWEKSKTAQDDSTNTQKLEQRWFAGVHSNVGGGYRDCGLSNRALQWLIDKAGDVGLCFHEPPHVVTDPKRDVDAIRNSYTWKYWFWPKVWRKIDLNDPLTNQTIDESVWARYDDYKKWKYKPYNLKPWVASRQNGGSQNE